MGLTKSLIFKRWLISFALLAYFVIGYLLINHVSAWRLAHDVENSWDRAISFVPVFILIYLTGYIFVFLPTLLVKDYVLFKRGALSVAIILTISFICFILYPVKVNRPELIGQSVWTPMFELLRSVDGPYNGLPSLHVSLAVISALICYAYRPRYVWLVVWALLIAASALFVKQHTVWDVVTGLLLGCAVYYFGVNRRRSNIKMAQSSNKY